MTRPARRAAASARVVTTPDHTGTPGYSGTPLVQKLGIKAGARVAFIDAPPSLPRGLADPPAGVEPATRLQGPAFDIILLFAERRAVLEKRFTAAARHLKPDGGLWVAWPKRASGRDTDLTEDRVREIALAAGLVDNKVCAVDEVWSGLRCVYRRRSRPAASRRT
jgi:hypothetical protein